MKNIQFRPGYYEWNVYLDDECIYTFGSDFDEVITNDTTCDDLKCIVDDHIYCMQEELLDNDKTPLDDKYIPVLKQQMLKQWSYHFNIAQ